jgi:hypothetical protein
MLSAVPFEVVLEPTHVSGLSTPMAFVVTDSTHWRETWMEAMQGTSDVQPLPTLDFRRESAIVLAAGVSELEDHLRLDSIRVQDQAAAIYYTLVRACTATTGLVHPVLIARAAFAKLPARFVEKVDRSRICGLPR